MHPKTQPRPDETVSAHKARVIVDAIELPDGRLIAVDELLEQASQQYRSSRKSHNLSLLSSRPKPRKPVRQPYWTLEQCQFIHSLYLKNDYLAICRHYRLSSELQAQTLASRARAKLRKAGLIKLLPRGPRKNRES